MKGLLTSLITVLTFTGLQAQSLPTAPKLVVDSRLTSCVRTIWKLFRRSTAREASNASGKREEYSTMQNIHSAV